MDSYKIIESFFIILLVMAFAEFISQKTKGYVSMLLTATVIFIAMFVLGANKELFKMAAFNETSRTIAISLIIVQLGTTLNIKTIISQWKTVVIALSSQAGIILLMLLVMPLIFNLTTALISIPPCGGGIVSVIITQEALAAKGMDSLMVYVLLVLIVNVFLGYPIASFLLKKEGLRILKLRNDGQLNEKGIIMSEASAAWPFKPFVKFFGKYKSVEIYLAKTAFIALIAYSIYKYSNFTVTPYIICFILGYLAKEVGFIETDVLKKANAYGFLSIINIAVIFSTLAITDLNTLATFWFPILIANIIAIVAMTTVSFFVGRFLGLSKYMSVGTGIACMFGFPGTYVIPGEVAKSITDNDEDHDFVFNNLYPRMLISGFVNVTVLSVLIASILVKFI